jgi:hypothetical protein
MRTPQKLIHLAYEGLKKNGLLVLQTPNTSSLPCVVMKKYWPCYGAPEHIHYFSRSNLRLLLEKNGFQSIRITAHIKPLRIVYVMDQLQVWGTEFYRRIKWMFPLIPKWLKQRTLPFYGGEMLVFAYKK